GYAVVRSSGKVIKSVTSAKSAATLEVEFRDGRFEIKSQKNVFTQSKDSGSDQGSLF
ncbi:MAG: exodeoxyribonuclease VII large subunit, partial [Rhodobacteraceae bacterium]|nr:exodeoxyribonuclease VII large subunit [Paracoccaceae bacterium]